MFICFLNHRLKVLIEFGLHIWIDHGWTTGSCDGEIISFKPEGGMIMNLLFTFLGGSVNRLARVVFSTKMTAHSAMSVFIPIVFLAYQICTSLWSAFGVSTTGKWDKYISLNFDRCSRVSASSTLLSMLRSWKCILERAALLPGGGVPSSLHLH